MVAVELEVLSKKFDRFGWDRDIGTIAHDRMITDWMDALQDYHLHEIQSACKAAIIQRPNKIPNEGHIIQQIMISRKSLLKKLPAPEVIEPDRDFSTAAVARRKALAKELLGKTAAAKKV